MKIKKSIPFLAPLVLIGVSQADVILDIDYTAPDYADGELRFQDGWLGQTGTIVDSIAGTATQTPGGGFLRNSHGTGARGGTGGVPTTTGNFQLFETIKISFQYSFTLADDSNHSIFSAGLRPEGPNSGNGFENNPIEGFLAEYNGFDGDPLVADDGTVKFFPDFNNTVDNNQALLLQGLDVGINPGIMDGSAVDLVSDPLLIEYLITNNGLDGFDVTSFTVTNLTTATTFTYGGPAQSFDWVDGGLVAYQDAFFAQRLANNSKAGFSGVTNGVLFEYDTAPAVRPIATYDYTAVEGYGNGDLQGQNGWIGQTGPTVDSSGSGTVTGQLFNRNMHSAGFRGSTGGVISAAGDFIVGESIEIIFDYQFTLGTALNDDLGVVGLRFEGPNAGNGFNSVPVQGFDMNFNGFDPEPLVSDDGSVKFYPDMNDTANADAMILEGTDVGISPGTEDGSAEDLISDNLRITYTILIDEDPIGADGIWDGLFTVSSFTVENLDTATTYTYSGPTQSFEWVDGGGFPYQDAFFAQQYVRSGATKGSTAVTDRVVINFLALPSLAVDPVITDVEMIGGNLMVTFEGTPSAEYKLTESGDLVTMFADTDPLQTTTTDGSGVGTLTLPATGTSNYVRVEEN